MEWLDATGKIPIELILEGDSNGILYAKIGDEDESFPPIK